MSIPLAGNAKVKSAIAAAIKENRLPHALLIEGDAGTGKHTLAKFIASAAVCSEENSPCASCKNCRSVSSGNHPDVSVTAPEEGKKNIAVAQIRQLKADCFVKPHIAKTRVFIIDSADTMNERSQNALLKVLEEPPGSTVFILIVETKAALLETILSRCVLLTLSPPETEVALEFIEKNHNYPKEDIISALQSCQNNIGKALLLLSGKIRTKALAAAKEYLDYMSAENLWGMLSVTAAFEKKRVEAADFFKSLKKETAERLCAKPAGDQAKALSRFYSALCELDKNLEANINLNLLFCTLVSKTNEIISNR